MRAKERIIKETVDIVNALKDSVEADLVKAHQGKLVDLPEAQLRKVTSLLKQSLDAAYQRSTQGLDKRIEVILNDHVKVVRPEKKR